MNDEIKEIREYISCPQFGDDHYGEWGALKLEQRIKIKSLLDYITNLQQENKRLKLKYKSQKDINQKLLSIDIKHKKINGELREENSKLKIALQNIQEDYDRRTKENERLKEEQEYNNYCDEQLRKKISNLEYKITTLENYKSRCGKAIEYLKSYNTDFEHCRFNEAPITLRELGDLLNILQNGDNKDD